MTAAVYTRISHDPEDKRAGVERQREDCYALAARLGYDVVAYFEDNDTSASTRTKKPRKQYDAMIAAAERGEFDAILFYSTSRLTRRPAEYERLITLVEKRGLRLQSVVSGNVELTTADGRAVARTLAAWDAAEAERTAERISRAAVQRAQQGKWHGPWPPFGYARVNGTLVVHDVHAAWVREAVERIEAGERAYAICRDWNRQGRRTPQDGPWSTKTFIRAITSPALVSKRTYKGDVVADGTWQPLLTQETYDRVCAVLLARAGTRPFDRVKHSTARKYPFTGLITCSNCGNGMYRQRWQDKVDTYVCARPTRKGGQQDNCGMRINAMPVEALITEAIFAAFDSPDVLRRLNADDKNNEKVAAARRAILEDERRLQQIDDDHYDGVLDRAAWLRQRARAEERIASSQKALDEAAARSVMRVEDIRDLRSTWESRTPDWQHAVARLVFDKVLIQPHPKGVATRLTPRKTESDSDYQQRDEQHRRDVLKARVKLVRRA